MMNNLVLLDSEHWAGGKTAALNVQGVLGDKERNALVFTAHVQGRGRGQGGGKRRRPVWLVRRVLDQLGV